MLKSILVILIVLLFVYKSDAQTNVSGHPTPLDTELLSSPIVLNDCNGIKIIEWRGSKDKPYTNVNQKSIEFMNKLCRLSFDEFKSFLQSKNLHVETNKIFNYTVSLMPWDPFGTGNWDGVNGDGDGDDYRNLQDYKWRFKDRMKFYDNNGSLVEIVGYTDRNINAIYMMNEPLKNNNELNSKFAEVFCHELFHAMSNNFGVYDILGKNVVEKQTKDEMLAKEFTKFLNIN